MAAVIAGTDDGALDGEAVKVLLHVDPQRRLVTTPSALPYSGETAGRIDATNRSADRGTWRDDQALGASPYREFVDARTEHNVLLTSSTSQAPKQESTYFYDQVMSGALHPVERVALLKPFARGVLSGTDTTLVYYEGSMPARAAHADGHDGGAAKSRSGLFDRHLSQCVAISLVEQLVAECRQRKLVAYLSFGVYHHREGHVVDVCGMLPRTALPLPTVLAPSCETGILFPNMHEINVVSVRTPSDVMRGALEELTRLEDRALLPSHATVFATLSVHTPVRVAAGSPPYVRVAKLTLMDVVHLSHLKLLCRVGNEPHLTPFLQRVQNSDAPLHPLPLLAFGVGMTNRCVVLASMPDATTSQVEAEVHDTSTDHSAGAVLACLSGLRKIVTAAAPFAAHIGIPAHVPQNELPLWQVTIEAMRLRRLLNSVNVRRMDDAHHCETSQIAQSQVLETIAARSALFCGDATAFLHTAGGTTRRLLWDRLQAIRRVEKDQLDHSASLAAQRRWLLSLPVVQDGQHVPSISERSRIEVLEKTVGLLESEGERQRQLFSRDIQLLLLELDAATLRAESDGQGVMSEGGAPVHQGHTLRVILQPLWELLLSEVELITSSASAASVAARSAEVEAAIEAFCHSLKRDAVFLTCSDSEQAKQQHHARAGDDAAYTGAASTKETAAVLNAALCGIASAFGVTLKPAGLLRGDGSGVGDPTDVNETHWKRWWDSVVVERATARAELHRVRHAAEALALHAHRCVEQLGSLRDELEATRKQPSCKSPEAGDISQVQSDVSSATFLHSKGRSQKSMTLESLLKQEGVPSVERAGSIGHPAAVQTQQHLHNLAFSIESCEAVVRALEEVALGCTEGRSLNDNAATRGDVSLATYVQDRLSMVSESGDGTASRSRQLFAAVPHTASAETSFGRRAVTSAFPDASAEDRVVDEDHHSPAVPTLRVALESILRGKRVVHEAQHATPRRQHVGVTRGFFSTPLRHHKDVTPTTTSSSPAPQTAKPREIRHVLSPASAVLTRGDSGRTTTPRRTAPTSPASAFLTRTPQR